MRRLMTLTFGEFPDNVLEIMEPHCPFYMGLRGEDFRSVERAINQGIDSYLEAVQFTQTGNRVDVTDAASVRAAFARVVATFGGVDIERSVLRASGGAAKV